MSLTAAIVRSITGIVRTAELMAGLALVVGVLINFANVIGRYVFSAPIPWAEEVMVFLMIAGVFLGAGAISLKGAHIRMDLAVQAMPPALQRAIDILGQVIFLVTAATLIWIAYPVILKFYDYDQRSEVIRLPIAYVHAVVPIGLGIMILAVFARLLEGKIGNELEEPSADLGTLEPTPGERAP